MKLTIVGLFMLMTAGLAHAQEASTGALQPPATKLEAFTARTGIVTIKAYTKVGVVTGLGRVNIDVLELRDALNPTAREYGIRIIVRESGKAEKENSSFIDADEIDSLIRGVNYIAKIDKSVTSLNEFEAKYKTRDDFAITTFSSRDGEVNVAVTSGRAPKASAFFKLSDMEQIKTFLTEAKAKIDAAKAAAR